MAQWVKQEHWADKLYDIKRERVIEDFHRSRRLFVIISHIVYLSKPGIPLTHAEWFESEGWLNNNDSSFIDTYVRGFVDETGIYGYIGYNFQTNREVEDLLTCPFVLGQFVGALNLSMDTKVFAGMIKQDTPGKFPPQKKLGTIYSIACAG